MADPDFRQLEITVVGLGLIGGSFAKALKKLSPKKIWAVDIDKDVLAQAESAGVIDKGYTDGSIPLSSSDLVVVCVYPELTVRFIKENMDNFRQGAVITDTAGLKAGIIREVEQVLRPDLDFIGGHPMAGKESNGFLNSDAEIFQEANYLITPVVSNREENLQLVEKMAQAIGCKQPIRMEPDRHDEIIALTSQLPHVLAIALMNCCQGEDTGMFIGGSFKDATRVARINEELWSELLLKNKGNVLNQIDLFADNLGMIKRALQDEDPASLKKILGKAGKMRATM